MTILETLDELTKDKERLDWLSKPHDTGLWLSLQIAEPSLREAVDKDMEYEKNAAAELWWCNSHGRKATHVDEDGRHRCDPKLGGIMLPCMAVNLTGIAEIVDDA